MMIRVCLPLSICIGFLVACSEDSDTSRLDGAATDLVSGTDTTSADGPVSVLDGPAFLDAPPTPDGQTDSQMDTVQPDTVKMCGNIGCDCTLKGIELWGKVKEVTAFPDFKVKVVQGFEDLKVKKVESFANSCGEWEFLEPNESFPDFTIEFVQSFPDFTIRYDSFPGLP
jgi:hypothetical protein